MHVIKGIMGVFIYRIKCSQQIYIQINLWYETQRGILVYTLSKKDQLCIN